ncbi:DUF3261 domain-containing protein [Shewanella gaetbuli]|uniref:DUF3261 domain-containing protein n=1 Tax=Shewanella gaetbuli TaxID=220752 RepID=A0A9X1ZQ33_9GAMM|nr:DUF3261 domain-containing protein [Shewanella gaetbuli]MCL1143512.1 DUF3261 domain-containing protein [Shewanella gaetbuli]
MTKSITVQANTLPTLPARTLSLLACWLLVTVVMVSLSGCSQQLQRQTCVTLASNLDYCLAPISQAITADAYSQTVEFTHDEKSHQLLTELQIDHQTMTLVGLAPLGQPLFTIVYDGDTILSQQSSLLGEQFKAEYLMAMLQLAYWPLEEVNQSLSNGQYRQVPCEYALCRQLIDNNQRVIEVNYSKQDPLMADIEMNINQANVHIKIQRLQ